MMKDKSTRRSFRFSLAKIPHLIAKMALSIVEIIWWSLQCLWLHLYSRHRYAQAVNSYIKNHLGKHKNTFSFLKALVVNPKSTGAILPSSKQLADTMASYISIPHDSLVVELGAGTGAITNAILAQGISPDRIIAIEYVPHLARTLRKQFPHIQVIEGNAANLTALLKDQTRPIGAVISGLPLLSIPPEIKDQILAKVPQVLAKQGQYIQFTYDITNYKTIYPDNYYLEQSAIVWRNIPPARVGKYILNEQKSISPIGK